MANQFISCLILSLLVCHSVESFSTFGGNTLGADLDISTPIVYDTRYFAQQVDHFSFSNSDSYQQKYLYADQYWDKESGPIFFYAGNEGDIELFCRNSGLMWDWAPEFKALLVFAEHRYYGASMPYGNDSYKDPAHLGYLTSEQALADFAELLLHLKATTPGLGDSPVIAFGGSYGGMLAAWFRMKYPHVINGAVACSAPIWQFTGLVECGSFNQVVTRTFEKSGQNCVENIRKSWDIITNLGKTASGRKSLQQDLRLCYPLNSTENVDSLKGWLSGIYVNLAMVDYPYPANFLAPLPAWPIKVVCEFLKSEKMTDQQLIQALGQLLNVYMNYTGSAQCFKTDSDATSSLGDRGWGYQACTEMVMPSCSDGIKDMFEPSPWDYPAYAKGCEKQWGVAPRPLWVITEYGGKNITAASNIIFSNGLLDPWSSGGVLTSLSDTLTAIIIEDGAHHLDLRAANPLDTDSVKAARKQEQHIITGWLNDHYKSKSGQARYMEMSVQSASEGAVSGGKTQRSTPPFLMLAVVLLALVLTLGAVLTVSRLRLATPNQHKYAALIDKEEKSPLV